MTTLYPTDGMPHSPCDAFFTLMAEMTGQRVYPFSSARAGLVFGLRALGLTRRDEVLVPPYLSHCVLSAISRVALPALAPSARTKAVLAWDPFGFPQRREPLRQAAIENDWLIIKDRAHALYGDGAIDDASADSAFEVFSLAKIFPCVMGGALTANHEAVLKALDEDYPLLQARHAVRAGKARAILEAAHREGLSGETMFEVEGVFGYLPEVVAFPYDALGYLPQSADGIDADRSRRRRIWERFSTSFSDRVPVAGQDPLAPFAIPIGGNRADLKKASIRLAGEVTVAAPVLHADFALNVLAPDYRPALMIGCHAGWTDRVVEDTISCLKDALS